MELIHAREEEVQIKLPSVPVSIQAKKERRDQITAEIKKVCSSVEWLFSGDVGVTIQLRRFEQEHYESDRAADIDNVIKPILDGLSGPDGVMIDDNQVQSVHCYWIQDLDAPNAILTIDNRLRECVYKDKLFFVHMGNQLYFPVNGFLPKEVILKMLEMLESYRATRAELQTLGVASYEDQRYLMPVQRYFHKTRLGKYRCIEIDEARREHSG
jgi:Holliday junction resolvase RusA-like endonuclease